jgi:hypothetical protein
VLLRPRQQDLVAEPLLRIVAYIEDQVATAPQAR